MELGPPCQRNITGIRLRHPGIGHFPLVVVKDTNHDEYVSDVTVASIDWIRNGIGAFEGYCGEDFSRIVGRVFWFWG